MNEFNKNIEIENEILENFTISVGKVVISYMLFMFMLTTGGMIIRIIIGDIFYFINMPLDQVILILPLMVVISTCYFLRKTKIAIGNHFAWSIIFVNIILLFFVVLFAGGITSAYSWILWTIAFIPVFLISHFFFRNLVKNAVPIKDLDGRIIEFKKTRFKEGIDDSNFREFLTTLGIGDVSYFFAQSIKTDIEEKKIELGFYQYIFAFDEKQLFIFEIYATSIIHLSILPLRIVEIANKVVIDEKKRLTIAGVNVVIDDIKTVQFENQEETFSNFIKRIDDYSKTNLY